MFDLTGRVALVTGAGQGIGEGITAALAAQGAVVAVNDRDADRAEAACERLRAGGATAVAAAFDVTDRAAVEAGVRAAEQALGGGIDILVNNAGVPAGMELRAFRELDPD